MATAKLERYYRLPTTCWFLMLTPQQAIEAPRFRSLSGLRLAIEDRVSEEALLDLRKRGHLLNLVEGWTATFGGALGHHDPETGVLTAAADPDARLVQQLIKRMKTFICPEVSS